MKLQLIEGNFAVCRLPSSAEWELPADGRFASVTRTPDELSIVCSVSLVPSEATDVESDWRMMRILGQIDFAAVGVLASLAGPLAAAGISIFVQSTFNTDYLMVKADKVDAVVQVLTNAGFEFT